MRSRYLRACQSVVIVVAVLGVSAAIRAQAVTSYFVQAGLPFLRDTVPVSISDGDAFTGGSARADATLGAEAHATALATNTLSQATAVFSSHSQAIYQDLVITGPTPTVLATLHVPFHANFIDHWSTWGGNFTFNSQSSHNAQFLAILDGLSSGREVGIFDIETFNRAANVEDVRIPAQSAGAGITQTITQTFFRATPVTSDPSIGAFAGSQVDETIEVRGEITFTGTMPTGVPLILELDLQTGANALSFFIADARSVTDGRDTLGVPQGGLRVFDLPAGYTANSASLGIVDNVVPAIGGTFPCPRPQGDWKNDPGSWPETSLLIGARTYDQTALLAILHTPVGSGANADASLILADQLIAAKLNVAGGSDPAPVSASIVAADALLSGFGGSLGYHVKPSSAAGKQLTAVAADLERYNTNLLTTGCSQ